MLYWVVSVRLTYSIMRHHDFGRSSEIVTYARYNSDAQILYLTYKSGPTTIAYCDVPPSLFDELLNSFYPDVCIRFKIQARHAFRRISKARTALDHTFIK